MPSQIYVVEMSTFGSFFFFSHSLARALKFVQAHDESGLPTQLN